MSQLRTAILKVAPPPFDDIDFAYSDFCGTETQRRRARLRMPKATARSQ